jgi:hypothetical protein
VERYSGERWRIATILDELLRVKAVRRLPDGRLEAISRTYATVRWDEAGVAAFGEQLNEHCATLLHNLNYPQRPRYVRRIVNAHVDPRYVPLLLRDLEQQTRALADSMDDALNDPKKTITGRHVATEAVSLGLTVYVSEGSGGEPPGFAGEAAVSPRGARRQRPRLKGRKA